MSGDGSDVAPWAAAITAGGAGVRVRFARPVAELTMTPEKARELAAMLLIVAEEEQRRNMTPKATIHSLQINGDILVADVTVHIDGTQTRGTATMTFDGEIDSVELSPELDALQDAIAEREGEDAGQQIVNAIIEAADERLDALHA